MFGGDLPAKLAGNYATDADLREDALGLIDWAIDALANASNLFAALDPDGTGIFDRYDTDLKTEEIEEENFIKYDATVDRRWELAKNNRALSAFLGEREHKVIASLETTSYTCFGVWYRIGAVSAECGRRDPSNGNIVDKGVKKAEGGPGASACGPLDPTMSGTATNPAFPLGGSASYVGETVAIMDEDVLTGTARVDVSWASGFSTSNAGSMSVTLGDLADATGDPLAYTGGNAPAAGYEIAEIVFSGLEIGVSMKGANEGQLIVGDRASRMLMESTRTVKSILAKKLYGIASAQSAWKTRPAAASPASGRSSSAKTWTARWARSALGRWMIPGWLA